MKPALIIYILRLILCDPAILAWLKEQAKKTDSPIDDYMVEIIESLLCPQK